MKKSNLTPKQEKINTILNAAGYIIVTCIMLLLFTIIVHIIKNPDSISYGF